MNPLHLHPYFFRYNIISHLHEGISRRDSNLPACQSALQPWVSLGLVYNQSPPGVSFLNKIIFYRMGLLAPIPTLEDQGVCLSLDSTLWPALLVVKLPPTLLAGSQSRTSPTTTTRWRQLWGRGNVTLGFYIKISWAFLISPIHTACYNIVTCRPVASQRRRNKQL
jgi:hypothetical protein